MSKISCRKLASKFYWWLQHIRRRTFGTKVDENIWKEKSETHVRGCLDNVSYPHRIWLAEKILSHLEIKEDHGICNASVLEIGCGCGANLEIIAQHAPSLQLIGIDISPASISVGRERFNELGIDVTLCQGQADSLSHFANKSIDIVFTDAILLYIGPDKIKKSIEEMKRIAKKAIILLEMHKVENGPGGIYTRDGWVRDYHGLCQYISNDIKLTPMSSALRSAGRWPLYGTLVEIKL